MSKQRQKGKITFTTIIFIIVIFYGGFVAVKIISANLTKSQIKNAIIDKFGYIRGDDFTPEEGEKIIIEILKEKGIIPENANYQFDDEEAKKNEENSTDGNAIKPPEIYVEFNTKSSEIVFFVEYESQTNLLIFKYKKTYTIEDKMRSYN